MESSKPARILVVSERTAATPALIDAIRARAQDGSTQFRLLVPNPAAAELHPLHPERRDKAEAAERVLADAIPELEKAAGASVIGSVSIRHDAMDAIEETLADEPIDEIILSTRPHNLERWLHIDLPHRVAHLGLPLTTVIDEDPPAETSADGT
jgi:hypothetical protein